MLTVAANEFLGVDPFLKAVSASAQSSSCASRSWDSRPVSASAVPAIWRRHQPGRGIGNGGVAFMILAVLFILLTIVMVGWPSSVYVIRQMRGMPLTTWDQLVIAGGFAGTVGLSIATWLIAMRFGVNGLESMSRR